MKKFGSILLAIILATGGLTGCNNKSAAPKISTNQNSDSSTVSSELPEEIIWMIRSDEPVNKDIVLENINEKLLADLNVTLDLRFISPGDLETKMQMAMAGGDDWDLCFTSNWANNYVNAAGKGAYLELDDLLEANAPDVMKEIPTEMWDGVRLNGAIYGIINYQVMYDQPGMKFLKSIVDELDLNVEDIQSWEDLTEIIAIVHEEKPDIYATRGGGPINLSIALNDPHYSWVMGLPFLTFDPETKQVSNTKYFEESTDAFETMREWQEKGYTPADAATLKDENTLLKQGMIFSRYERVKPGVETTLKNNTGLEWVVVPIGDAIIDTSAAQSSLTAVNVNSNNPEKAIQLYNYFFSNEEVFNLAVFGIEGQDYNLMEGNQVEKIQGEYSAPAWQLGNQFNAYLNVGDEPDTWERTKEANAEAMFDPLFGFVADRSQIETELATCEAIWGEYKDILSYGLQDHTIITPELMDKLNKAGLPTITEEIQKQIDLFVSEQ